MHIIDVDFEIYTIALVFVHLDHYKDVPGLFKTTYKGNIYVNTFIHIIKKGWKSVRTNVFYRIHKLCDLTYTVCNGIHMQ